MSNNANAHPSFYQSTNSSTSTLRPRNNRLISYEDDPSRGSSVASQTSNPSPHDSRSASPSSTSQARNKGRPQTVRLHDSTTHKRNKSENVDRRASSGIWESWSSLQGIASTFLGSDAPTNGPVRRANSTNVKKSSGRMQQDKSYGLKQSQPEWGPQSQKDSKPTSIEDHKSLLQVKKREALLLQSAAVEAGQDSLGRYKRKGSNASIRSPIDHENLDNDVLVYRHKVQPHDTMAGVVIKYSCQHEAFRKANRFWPNDNIQRRDWVVLPVDACAVRGRKTEAPYVDALLEEKEAIHPLSTATNGTDSASSTPQTTEQFPAPPTNGNAEESEYKHNSWVILPTSIQPVEVLRISKRALGYFPPARRKSLSRTGSSTPFTDSTASTPKTSFDMLRHPPTHAAQQAAQAQLSQQIQASLNLNSSPNRASSIPRHLTSASRARSTSTVSTTTGTSQNAFITALSGPGGVGTLRGLRSERARPGPAEDSLNKKFAGYFPELLPPDQPEYQAANSLGSSLQPPHSRTTSTSRRTTPRASMDSIRSTRSNSSSVPAAIAGWVGKVASSPMRKKSDRDNLSLIGEDAADLIELSDTPDEVTRQLHDAADEDEERTPTATDMPTLRMELGFKEDTRQGGKIGKTDDELLNERFPVRGRVRRAYEAD